MTLAAIAEDSGARLITQAELLANATDVDGPALTAINLAISSGNGTLVDNGNGTWSYTPAANDDTSVTFSYAVTDGIAAPVAASATLDITPVNDAPTTTPVTLGRDRRGQRGAADHPGRAAGQRHGRGRAGAHRHQPGDLVWQRHAGRQRQRHLELYAGGQRRHVGDVQLCGDRRHCGAGGDHRHPRHHAGERRAGHHAGDLGRDRRGQRGAADHPGRASGQRHGRGRPALTAINLAISSGNGTLVDNGNGTWSYTPAVNDDTSVTFSYAVTDGVAAAWRPAPPSTSPRSTRPIAPGNDASDSGRDCRGQRGAADHPGRAPGQRHGRGRAGAHRHQPGDPSGNGTLVDNGNGTWSYTPALNDDTSVTFSYAVTDGIAAPVATTASLDITPVNDAPTTTPVTLAAIAEDSGARLITQAELLANATDVDGPALTAVNLAISSGNGTLVDNGNGTWSYTPAVNDDTLGDASATR